MAWTFTLNDRVSDTELADISSICLQKTVSPRLNRPWSVVVTCPADQAVLRDTSFDGDQAMTVGTRTLKAYQDGVLRANTVLWNVAPTGDVDTQSVQLTGFDPIQMLIRRPVRQGAGEDITGDWLDNLIDPLFPSPISGAAIMIDVLSASNFFEGPPDLPFQFAGGGGSLFDIDVGVGLATDLGALLTDYPMFIGDLLAALTATGDFDFYMNPQDTHTGAPAGMMGALDLVNSHGNDLSGIVHFDYGIGDFNTAQIRRTFDMDEICNKLYYYLGPKETIERWQSNITGTETGATANTEDLSAYEALQIASRAKYGTYMDIKIYDSLNIESLARPLFHRLWREEVMTRYQPREMLYVTPNTGAVTGAPVFRPLIDYAPGDVISVNAADIVGPAISAAKQRVYGFDITEDIDGVERVGELICASADE